MTKQSPRQHTEPAKQAQQNASRQADPTRGVPPNSASPVIIGIDWASQKHDVCVIDPATLLQEPKRECLEHCPEAILRWADKLRQAFPGRTFAVVMEQSRGALAHALLDAERFTLFPINPKQLSRFRDALYPSGSKNDVTDALLLAQFFQHHKEHLRAWLPDTVETRRISNLAEFRRRLVEDRTRLTLKLSDALKLYFPFVTQHFSGSSLASKVVTKLLGRWSTLSQLKRAHPKTLKQFFQSHGLGESRAEELATAARKATALTTDAAIVDSYSSYAASLSQQLSSVVESIAKFDSELAELTAAHEDEKIFRSLPGAGDALVPRLIAAFGTDRGRFGSAEEVQNYSGISPVTEQSGKSRVVKKRFMAPTFVRQTFHEFAEHSRRWSKWAKLWFEQKKANGMGHQAAVRALAFKWIRIIYRLWQSSDQYDESRYIESLIKSGSPLAAALQDA